MKNDWNAERHRLEIQRAGTHNWRLWGPYLCERAWGTVREDCSARGGGWEYFDHDQARARAYRWTEDGLGGICDEQQRLCFALALWNGQDPILKERAFGLPGRQGYRGEGAQDFYYYQDATPSHSYLRYVYKYPQAAFPYDELAKAASVDPRSLLDTGVFEQGYWDIDIIYAKASPTEIYARIEVFNRGPNKATLHVLPTLWFRNTWSWGEPGAEKPRLRLGASANTEEWVVEALHSELGDYFLHGRTRAQCLFTENETNTESLWRSPNASPYVKDAFHRYVIHGEQGAVNPAQEGTRFAAWHRLEVESGASATVDVLLAPRVLLRPFARTDVVIGARQAEADAFYDKLVPKNQTEDQQIVRQSLAGMIWNKQFYHYDVARWQDVDLASPPPQRMRGRNRNWRHFAAADVISVPDSWRFPWLAAWDMSYHCSALALVDVDFAKDQIELLVNEDTMHPDGQLPSYEWNLGRAVPPLHAMAALNVFRAERTQRRRADLAFLERVFHKLLLHYAWWINRRDVDGRTIFEGGIMDPVERPGVDGVPNLPLGAQLKPVDTTGWLAVFALNMTSIALELAAKDPNYQNIAIQTHKQFLAIANAIAGFGAPGNALWDERDRFYKDLVVAADGKNFHLDEFSWAGLVPLFACEVIGPQLLHKVPKFREHLRRYEGGIYDGNQICACPEEENGRGEHLLALVDPLKLAPIIERILDHRQFLAPYGVRSLSLIHARERGSDPDEQGGTIWIPPNYSLLQALDCYHQFLGERCTVTAAALDDKELNLAEVANLITERLIHLFRRDPQHKVPAMRDHTVSGGVAATQGLTAQELLLFHEYFDADTGKGLGASHHTGSTALIANLLVQRYRAEQASMGRVAHA